MFKHYSMGGKEMTLGRDDLQLSECCRNNFVISDVNVNLCIWMLNIQQYTLSTSFRKCHWK